MFGRLLREPLVHFLVLGGLLFAVFGRGGPGPKSWRGDCRDDGRRRSNRRRICHDLAEGRRPEDELRGAVDDYVREQILYRKALSSASTRTTRSYAAASARRWIFSSRMPSENPATGDLQTYLHREFGQVRDRAAHFLPSGFRQLETKQPRGGRAKRFSAPDCVWARTPKTRGDPLLLPQAFDLTPLSQVSIQFGESFGPGPRRGSNPDNGPDRSSPPTGFTSSW